MSVRLQNQGKRTITIAKGNSIAPKSVAIVNEGTAKKLLRLYPKELFDIDNLVASFDEGAVKDMTTLSDDEAKKPAKAAKEPKAAKVSKKKDDAEEDLSDEDALAAELEE